MSRPCPRPGAVGPASGGDGGRPLTHPAAGLAPQQDEAGGARAAGGPAAQVGTRPHAEGRWHRGQGGEDMTPGSAQSFAVSGPPHRHTHQLPG